MEFTGIIKSTKLIPLLYPSNEILHDTSFFLFNEGLIKNDFQVGKRHNLPIINILNKDGTLNDYGLNYQGMTCEKARPKLVQELEEKEILINRKALAHMAVNDPEGFSNIVKSLS